MSESMLEITKRVLPNRQKDLPYTEHMKSTREYFEKGCLCVDAGDISIDKSEPDDVACLFYIMWCGCSRHYDATLRCNV